MGRNATRKSDRRSINICAREDDMNFASHAPNPVSKSQREKRMPRTISFPSKTFINSRITVIWVITEDIPRAVIAKRTGNVVNFRFIGYLNLISFQQSAIGFQH